jgi:hypothetical protein
MVAKINLGQDTALKVIFGLPFGIACPSEELYPVTETQNNSIYSI